MSVFCSHVHGGIMCLALGLSALSAHAQTSPDPKFDLNGDGFVSEGRELDLYLAHRFDPVLAKYDANLNGLLDATEVEKRRVDLAVQNEDQIFLVRDDLLRDMGSEAGIPIATARPTAPAAPKSEWQTSFRLRNSFSEPSVISATPDTPQVLAATPFRLSFSRDYQADTDSWGVQGAAFYEWRRNINTGSSLAIEAYSLGIEVNQLETAGVTAADTIAARVGGAWLFQSRTSDPFISSHFLSANSGWITDSDGDLSVLSLQARYQPLLDIPGFGGNAAVFGDFRVRVTPTLTADFNKVYDDGGQPQFTDADEYLYLGGALEAFFSFADGPLKPLSARLKFQAFSDVASSGRSLEYFEAGLGWALTEDGHTQFNLTYVNGETPTSPDVEQLQLGIGLAF